MKKIKILKLPILWICMLLFVTGGIYKIYKSIPDTLYIDENKDIAYALINQEPWVTSSEAITVSSSDSYTVTCKLWNIIPLKNVTISQVEAGEVAVSGRHVGIYLETAGILVVGMENIISASGEAIAPAENILQKGDYIKRIDGQELTDKDILVSYMKSSEGTPVSLDIVRDGQEKQVLIQPVFAQDETYKLGIWVKDSAQGIGTITYVTSDGRYGALGHGVSDGDTGEIIGISSGDLYTSDILSVQKGTFGTPGELCGVINYGSNEHLGTIEENTSCGIFGKIDDDRIGRLQSDWYPIAFKQELQTGPAAIICSTDDTIQEYEIEIEDIFWSPNEKNKCFAIHVTDDELLQETGGIVQGLSGSPIIQDGKLVGAVTHVLVNDPTRGYGIFIENMLDAAG